MTWWLRSPTALTDHSTVDVVEGFCMQLPSHVISEMLGIPEDRWAWVRDVTHRIVQLIDPMIGFDPEDVNDAVDEIWEVIGAMADERRDDPRDDLITALVRSRGRRRSADPRRAHHHGRFPDGRWL